LAGARPTRIITYARGEKYLELLLSFSLPALLAPGNLPYVAANEEHLNVTPEDDALADCCCCPPGLALPALLDEASSGQSSTVACDHWWFPRADAYVKLVTW
jgi:hypothetical protein